jgi:hypothetical protein
MDWLKVCALSSSPSTAKKKKKKKKKKEEEEEEEKKAEHQWLMPVILATQGAEIRRLEVRSQPGQREKGVEGSGRERREEQKEEKEERRKKDLGGMVHPVPGEKKKRKKEKKNETIDTLCRGVIQWLGGQTLGLNPNPPVTV